MPRLLKLRAGRLHQLDDVGVGDDGHLLDVADEAVRRARREEVECDEEAGWLGLELGIGIGLGLGFEFGIGLGIGLG